MGIAVDDQGGPGLYGTAHVSVIEIKPVRSGVHFENQASGRRLLDHPVQVEIGGLSLAQQTARRVAQHIDQRVPYRPQNALGDCFTVLAQRRMHRSDDHVQAT